MNTPAALFRSLLGREIDAEAARGLAGREPLTVALELLLSAEVTDRLLAHPIDCHHLFVHRARQWMLRTLLPAADRILDLGGANAPLYRSGYPHPFTQLVMVDLPPDDRHAMYRDVPVANAPGVSIHYGDMADLSAFPDASFDMAWSGESIEHIEQEAAERMIAEVFRVLVRGGVFCLDTPNRTLTEIHTRGHGDGFIHPDHRHEYRPKELRALLEEAGFEVEAEHGICTMPQTRTTGTFHYADFILGNPITDCIEDGYLLFFKCRKP